MDVLRKKDITCSTVRAKIEPHNQDGAKVHLSAECVEALTILTAELKETCKVTSGGNDQNGGFLMHFSKKEDLRSSLPTIEQVVIKHDKDASITAFNAF